MRSMRKHLLMVSTALALTMAGEARAANWVAALAARPQDGAKDSISELIKDLYGKLGPGDNLVVIDGTNLREVARISVPANPAIAGNRNLKARLLSREFGKVWDFADDGATASGEPGDVSIPQLLIELPAILDTLPGRKAEVVIAGSAIYADAREPSFSMTGGYVPSDAHLLLTQDKSPFGIAGRATALSGATIHFCTTNPAGDWTTDLFRQHVERLWALSTVLEGGRFGGFAPLDRGCIDGFLNQTASSETFALDRTDHKVTMVKFERNTARQEPEPPSAAAAAPATAEALFARPPCSTAPRAMTGPMRIGIRWTAPADLDLYARSGPQGEWLYYAHRVPADGNGYFDHDFRAPPPGEDAYEYVEFKNVDLREVAARVNFYEGNVDGGPSFRLRVWFAGCTYDAALHLAAPQGNEGHGSPPDPHWVTVDVPSILHVVGAEKAARR